VCIPVYHQIYLSPDEAQAFFGTLPVTAATTQPIWARLEAGTQNPMQAARAIMVFIHESYHNRLLSADEGYVNACALRDFGYWLSRDFQIPATTTGTVTVPQQQTHSKQVAYYVRPGEAPPEAEERQDQDAADIQEGAPSQDRHHDDDRPGPGAGDGSQPAVPDACRGRAGDISVAARAVQHGYLHRAAAGITRSWPSVGGSDGDAGFGARRNSAHVESPRMTHRLIHDVRHGRDALPDL
jgi:hypothetical protein